MSSTTTATSPVNDEAIADSFGEYLVLSKTFEAMLKKPEDDEDQDDSSAGAADYVNQLVAGDIARVVTGFGE